MQGRFFSLYSGVSMMPAMLGVLGTGFFSASVGLLPSFVLSGTGSGGSGSRGRGARRMLALDRQP